MTLAEISINCEPQQLEFSCNIHHSFPSDAQSSHKKNLKKVTFYDSCDFVCDYRRFLPQKR